MCQGFVIPVYNHGNTLEGVVSALQEYTLPIIVVDDGNDAENKSFIKKVAETYPNITVVANKRNRGKGYSVCKAVKEAYKMGITHLFQIDADGQHDAKNTCRDFLQASTENPDALICGYPEFDDSLPKMRVGAKAFCNFYARYLTLDKTGEMKDSMCGYRIYPVEPFYKICRRALIDSHMGFDPEILVRLIWKGVPIIYKKVRVTYPVGGKSNFRVVRDNIHISLMYTRLTLRMWLTYPILRARKKRAAGKNQNDEK